MPGWGWSRQLAGVALLLSLGGCGSATPAQPTSTYVQWGYKGEARVPDLLVPDHDGDGVDNTWDRCPDLPEDVDAFQDGDGCPDADHDGDGVPDGKRP